MSFLATDGILKDAQIFSKEGWELMERQPALTELPASTLKAFVGHMVGLRAEIVHDHVAGVSAFTKFLRRPERAKEVKAKLKKIAEDENVVKKKMKLEENKEDANGVAKQLAALNEEDESLKENCEPKVITLLGLNSSFQSIEFSGCS